MFLSSFETGLGVGLSKIVDSRAVIIKAIRLIIKLQKQYEVLTTWPVFKEAAVISAGQNG